MAGIAGKDGLLKISSDTMAEVKSWSLNPTTDMLDDTALGDEWKTQVPGLSGWSASVEVSWNMSDTAQLAVQTAFLGKTSVTVSLYVNATNYYTGTAYISGLTVEDPVDGLVTASLELTGSGSLTYN